MKIYSIQMLKNYFGTHDEGRKKIFEEAEKMHEEEIKNAFNSQKILTEENYYNEEFKNENL